MSKITKEDVYKRIEEENVRFIRLQFTDLLGTIKNVEIPLGQLEKALNNEMMFDGSSIEGFVRIEESDMRLHPDLDTFVVFPWTSEKGKVARFICDIYNPDGTPFEGCPRYNLKRNLERMEKLGFTAFNIGTEPEFFLFKLDEMGEPSMELNDKGGYFDLAPTDLGENCRRDIVLELEEMGFEIEASTTKSHQASTKSTLNIQTRSDTVMIFRRLNWLLKQLHVNMVYTRPLCRNHYSV